MGQGDMFSLADQFTFQHLETDDDVAEHLEVMRTVFGQDSRVDLMVKKWIEHYPAITLKDFFVIKHHGKIVACLNLVPSKWSIGDVPLKVAELACVATLPNYRRQGLQRKLMEEYHKRIEADNYDLSAIEGIPYYYRQFGYEYALPLLEETRIDIDKMPEYKIAHCIRPFKQSDIPRASELLEETQQKFHVYSVRENGIWKMHENTRMMAEYNFNGYVIEEKGHVTVYFRVSENLENKELYLREITNVDQYKAQSILRFMRDIGMDHELKTLISTASFTEPFTMHLVATGQTKQSPPYAWQIRITDYAKMLSKMKRLFEKRLLTSTFRSLTEKLNFNLYRYTVQMIVENGEITSVQRLDTNEDRMMRFNPQVFAQLLLGYRSREELEAIYPDFLVKPSHKLLIDTLFPKMPSFIHTNY